MRACERWARMGKETPGRARSSPHGPLDHVAELRTEVLLMHSWIYLVGGAVLVLVVLLTLVLSHLAAPAHEDRHPPS